MTPQDFEAVLMHLPYNLRAERVNKIQKDAQGTDFYNLVALETRDLENDIKHKMKMATSQEHLAILGAEMRGLQRIVEALFKPWTIDEQEKKQEEENLRRKEDGRHPQRSEPE